MKRHLVIGAGEVGTALAEVLRGGISSTVEKTPHVILRDVEPSEDEYPGYVPDFIHICFPWSENFTGLVRFYEKRYGGRVPPSIVVVHSTVPVGTCDPNGWVHSPVRGMHPHLVEGIRTFVKHFGGERAIKAAQVFVDLQIEATVHDRAGDTEAGKLWEMVSFGLQIVLEKSIHAYCAAHGLDYETVYGDFSDTYNDGYTELGQSHFVRPILAHVPGPIGGHCVLPSADMLDEDIFPLLVKNLSAIRGAMETMDGGTSPEVPTGGSTPKVPSIHPKAGGPPQRYPQEGNGGISPEVPPDAYKAKWRKPLSQSPKQVLAGASPNLIEILTKAGNEWGPLRVAHVAALLTDPNVLVDRLRTMRAEPKWEDQFFLPLLEE